MVSRDQSAVFIMSVTATPTFLAADAAAPLHECALNIAVSIPASFRVSFSHLAMVGDDTGLCGLLWDMKRGF